MVSFFFFFLNTVSWNVRQKMGNQQWKMGTGTIPHLWIQKPTELYLGEIRTRVLGTPKPNDLGLSIHDMVWLIFTSQLDQYVRKFNVWKRKIRLIFMSLIGIGVLAEAFALIIFRINLKYLYPFWAGLIPLCVFWCMLLLRCDMFMDDKIQKVCKIFEEQFQKSGFTIEYKTGLANFCDSQTFYSYRIILFHPSPLPEPISIENVATTNNNDEVDVNCDNV